LNRSQDKLIIAFNKQVVGISRAKTPAGAVPGSEATSQRQNPPHPLSTMKIERAMFSLRRLSNAVRVPAPRNVTTCTG
jgi:hypothetical protein